MYRFLNKDNIVVYVGRTINLDKRFINHSHLTDDVIRIEYIKCNTYADMVWKEVYYINFFYNQLSTNISDVYNNGAITDMNFKDTWKMYKRHNTQFSQIAKENVNLVTFAPKMDYKNLIHITEHQKLNAIGDDEYALSQKWFNDARRNGNMTVLSRHVTNFFRNVAPKEFNFKGTTKNTLWTTFYQFKDEIKGKGFSKGFVELGSDYEDNSNRHALAYVCNNFYMSIKERDMFNSEDEYALSFLLKFIFNSALKDGKEIGVYVPSIRMRRLLKAWIEENSISK